MRELAAHACGRAAIMVTSFYICVLQVIHAHAIWCAATSLVCWWPQALPFVLLLLVTFIYRHIQGDPVQRAVILEALAMCTCKPLMLKYTARHTKTRAIF